ncbi:MAG: helix-turn-helix transcriptional regulator [Prevotella sp.]|nr:helix-turn-helix transcriptional regulator [Prevotella sp.]
MKQHNNTTFQTLTSNERVQIGYSDGDIIVLDNIQKLSEIKNTRIPLIAIVICLNGSVRALVDGQDMPLHEKQVAIIPQNVNMSDFIVSPDFNVKGLLLTNRVLQSFLHEKMQVWNNMMYVHRMNVLDLDDEDMRFYSHFHEMLRLSIERTKPHPYRAEVIQSLLRALVTELCGTMSIDLPASDKITASIHFQKFLDLLHSEQIKYRTVEAYADELCISPKYLTAICKKQSGKTAIQWIREQLLENIRYYLKHTDFSIKQICDKLGFPNTSFFGKYVKDHFGMTPVQLRNS